MCDHVSESSYDRRRGDDGRERAYCKLCGKFLGYYAEEAKQPAKPIVKAKVKK